MGYNKNFAWPLEENVLKLILLDEKINEMDNVFKIRVRNL